MSVKLKIAGIVLLGALFYIRLKFFSEKIKHYIDLQVSNTNENVKLLSEFNDLSKDHHSALNVYADKAMQISVITNSEFVKLEENLVVMILLLTFVGILCSIPLGSKGDTKIANNSKKK